MKINIVFCGLVMIASCGVFEMVDEAPKSLVKTICNPIDVSYRFMPETPSRREAADPTIISFKGNYFLFASKSGGYWYSDDLAKWQLVETDEIPTEEYAPTAIVLRDTVFFLGSSKERSVIYKSADPISGKWEMANDSLEIPVWDPAFFQDDDGELYLYWGCSNIDPLYGVKINDMTFKFEGAIQEVIYPNPEQLGWEIRGDYNEKKDVAPWLEGPWMNKHNGKYYLQYAAPGTLEKSYSDGVYIGDQPLGPFELAAHNPFAYKPEGFICGAGHGSTFQDAFDNYWHVGTLAISQKHKFERRVGIYPTFFDEDDVLYAYTRFGDYPMNVPSQKVSDHDLFAGWMLLSYKKPAYASSTLDEFPIANVNDEEVRTNWSAVSGEPDEWIKLDLLSVSTVHAVQLNFAEVNTELYSRSSDKRHAFILEGSEDNENWFTVEDFSKNKSDRSHIYLTFNPVQARYLKVTNVEVPDGNFAMSGFRAFGLKPGTAPAKSAMVEVNRDTKDKRDIHLQWKAIPEAMGYNIRFGTDAGKLYQNYLVYDTSGLTIRSLNKDMDYFFAVEPFNESGVGELSEIVGPF
ncbi:MAG: family 43 glycosylhydrolase [Bacteroidota bacterium]